MIKSSIQSKTMRNSETNKSKLEAIRIGLKCILFSGIDFWYSDGDVWRMGNEILPNKEIMEWNPPVFWKRDKPKSVSKEGEAIEII